MKLRGIVLEIKPFDPISSHVGGELRSGHIASCYRNERHA